MPQPMAEVYIDETVRKVRALHQSTLSLDKSTIGIGEFLALQARTILTAHQAGDTAVKFHLACWCSPLIAKSTEEIMQFPLKIEHVQQTIAAEHGFTNWTEVETHHSTAFDLQFESCIDSMLDGDIQSLVNTINAKPSIVSQRSQYGLSLIHIPSPRDRG